MSHPLLSIIVPVYNVEPYITACLDSVLAQSFQDFEVILADDGSTDDSGKICDAYASRDPRFRVIHKTNGGVSSARNAALEIHRGKYLTMLDPDDAVAPDTYENVLYLEEHPEVDILQFPYVNCFSNGKIEKLFVPSQTFEGKKEILKNWWEGNILHFSNLNKIFRASVFEGIRYREGHLSEDTYLIADFIEKAQKVYISEKGQYFVKMRNDSLTTRYDFNKHMDLFVALFRTYKELCQYPELQAERVKAFYRLYRRLISAKLSTKEASITPYLEELKAFVPVWKDIRNCPDKAIKRWISTAKIFGLSNFTKLFCHYLSLKDKRY